MKNNLGKIILFLFFIPYILNAQVVLKAPNSYYENDLVYFTIIAQGSNVSFPEIKNIDGNIVQNAGTKQQTTIINGAKSVQVSKSYAILSTKDIALPSFEITVDNKIEKTKPKIIKVKKVEKTKSDLYDLTITTDKTEAFVGEAVEFSLKFKYKKDLELAGLDFEKPTFENFWVKELPTQKNQDNYTQYVEQELKYLLFPQKAGTQKLGALKIGVKTYKSSYGAGFYLSDPTQTTNVYSNKINLKVKALPDGVSLIGDFDIKATVDKTTVNQGDAVSYKLYISGRGNIDDLDEVKLNIAQTTIYDNPSTKEYNLENNLYGGKYTKIYSIVGQNDFTIPSIKLQYFDKKTQTIKTIETKSYDIKVNGIPKQKAKLELQEPKQEIQDSNSGVAKVEVIKITSDEKIIYFLFGLVVGIIVVIVFSFFKNKTGKNIETPLLKSIQNTKTPKELFKVLLVYINIDEELDKIIYKLETLSQEEFKKEKKNINNLIKELMKKDIQLETYL